MWEVKSWFCMVEVRMMLPAWLRTPFAVPSLSLWWATETSSFAAPSMEPKTSEDHSQHLPQTHLWHTCTWGILPPHGWASLSPPRQLPFCLFSKLLCYPLSLPNCLITPLAKFEVLPPPPPLLDYLTPSPNCHVIPLADLLFYPTSRRCACMTVGCRCTLEI